MIAIKTNIYIGVFETWDLQESNHLIIKPQIYTSVIQINKESKSFCLFPQKVI